MAATPLEVSDATKAGIDQIMHSEQIPVLTRLHQLTPPLYLLQVQ